MNSPLKKLQIFSFAILSLALLGCGVKGDPLPPEKPADLGRGRPTYKRAIEGLKLEKLPAEIKDDDTDEDDQDEE